MVQIHSGWKRPANYAIGLFFVLSCLATVAVANAASLNWGTNTTIPLTSPSTDFIVVSGSVADSFVVNTTGVMVTLSSSTGGSFTLTSASLGLTIATSSSGGTVTTSCASGVASATITQGTGSTVYTITPSASQCVIPPATPGPSVGVGGGGGVSQFAILDILSPKNNTTVSGQITVTASSLNSQQISNVQLVVDGTPWGSKITTGSPYILSLDTKSLTEGVHIISVYAQNSFGDTARAIPVTIIVVNKVLTPGVGASTVPPAQPSPPPASSTAVFTNHLEFGDRGEEVSALQKLLFQEGVYPEGIVSGYFGSLTREAVKLFQEKYGIAGQSDLGYGTVGPKTRAKLNALSSGYIQEPLSRANNKFPFLTEPLYFTKEGAQVFILQNMLSQDPEIYPEKRITGYYGQLTIRAVQRFQAKYDIVSGGSSETTGYGLVGPKTRAKLNDLYGQK